MFEKKAEEIANKKLCSERICYNHCNFNSPKHHRCGEWHRIYESSKEGAEFGYNKAMEEQGYKIESAHREGVAFGKDQIMAEMQEQGLALQSDMDKTIDQNIQLKKQIEKMKVCQNCDNWNWKHNKCEKKLKGDCFKHSK